jgi:hypothetical protein
MEQQTKPVRRCTRCILPATFPGIHFDKAGVCQFCHRQPSPEKRAERKARLRARFEALVEQIRPRPGYHCLVAWSGGKDSTYTLWLLKKQFGLHVLAFTFDNGFVSPAARKNIRVVAENLGVDYILVKPRFDLLRQLFIASIQSDIYPPRALERASSICNTCMALAKGIGLRLALEREIPLLAYGWSPGQAPLSAALFRTTPSMLRAFLRTAMAPLQKATDGKIQPYFPQERHLEAAQELPYNVSPLGFLEYDEASALRRIGGLGWQRPQDTDPNSTNCLLNSFANQVHMEQMGYHPYVMELASLVREGYMSRQEALSRLEAATSPEVVAAVRAKLRIPHRWRRQPPGERQ